MLNAVAGNYKKINTMVKTFQNENSKGVLIQIPKGSSDYQISAEYRPYSVWLEMKGRSMPMPIGNMIYPYRHDQLKIAGTTEDSNGLWLILEDVS